MKEILKTESVNSVKTLREMMDIIDEAALGSALSAAKKFGGGAMTGFKYPYSANLNPASTSATMRGIRTGAPIGKNPAEYGAGAASTIGATGAASELGSNEDPALSQHPAITPQDPATRGSGYLDATNPGYNYKPYDDGDPGTVIDIDGEDEGPGTVIDIDGEDKGPQSPTSVKSHMQSKPHPAGQPASAKPKFDPAVQKQQYELKAKGYPVKTNGILDDATTKALDWERQSAERDARITGYDELKADMDQSTAPPEPFDNPQGDFDRMPELNESTELHRILQIAQWR
jgi:hypothetical protein